MLNDYNAEQSRSRKKGDYACKYQHKLHSKIRHSKLTAKVKIKPVKIRWFGGWF